jgi:hypothetical protein
MMDNLRVTFILDGSGVYYDPAEPIHLDSLLVRASVPHHAPGHVPTRDEEPDDIPIPLARWHIAGQWGWKASAIFPDGVTASAMQHWRKKFRTGRIHLTNGSPNLTNATWREYNEAMPLLLCHSMVAWCVGERRKVLRELRRSVTHLGRKASMGKGRVNAILVDRVDEDWSILREGRAQRWLPAAGAPRRCRPRPPYWNNVGRIATCEVGAVYEQKTEPVTA